MWGKTARVYFVVLGGLILLNAFGIAGALPIFVFLAGMEIWWRRASNFEYADVFLPMGGRRSSMAGGAMAFLGGFCAMGPAASVPGAGFATGVAALIGGAGLLIHGGRARS